VAPPAVILAVGLVPAVTVVIADVAEQPLAFVTLTEYEPALEALID
jgi:hypothetical protein